MPKRGSHVVSALATTPKRVPGFEPKTRPSGFSRAGKKFLRRPSPSCPDFPTAQSGGRKFRPHLPNAAEIACGPLEIVLGAHISLRKRLVSLTACPHTHDGNKTDHCVCRGYLRLDSLRKSLKVAEFIKRNLVLLGEGVDTRK